MQKFTMEGVCYQREIFVSRPEQVLAMKLTVGEKGKITMRISMNSKLRHSVSSPSADCIQMYGYALVYVEPPYVHDIPEQVGYEENIECAKSTK